MSEYQGLMNDYKIIDENINGIKRFLSQREDGIEIEKDILLSWGIGSITDEVDKLRWDLIKLLDTREELRPFYTKNHPRMKELDTRINLLTRDLVSLLKDQLRVLEGDKRRIELEMKGIKSDNVKFMELGYQLSWLQSDVNTLRTMLASLEQQYQQKRIQGSYGVEYAVLVEPAIIPKSPVKGKSGRMVFLGVIFGLIMGLGIAMIRESMDFSLSLIDEVEEFIGLKVLGIITHFDLQHHLAFSKELGKDKHLSQKNSRKDLVLHFWPKSVVSENFRSLRHTLMQGGIGKGSIIMITSGSPREGKSFIATNLALAFAQGNYKTCLVEMDMRRSSLHRIFGIKRGPGLMDIIEDNLEWGDCFRGALDMVVDGMDPKYLQITSGLERLSILTAGGHPTHPTETLELLIRTDFFNRLRSSFDITVLDSPAVVPVADSCVIAPQVDKVLLIYRMGKTPRDLIKRACESLTNINVETFGIVLADVDMEIASLSPGPHYKYYKYGYGEYSPPVNILNRYRHGLRKSARAFRRFTRL